MDSKSIREAFLNYFGNKGHEAYPSFSLIPHDDETLLFVNAGMAPLKDRFTKGVGGVHSATTSQKCVRAGGKHNDIENVGYTARHHTFFEMLGNFSFGEYFKDKAIDMAWDFLVNVLKIDHRRLVITIHTSDDEAFEFWKKYTSVPSSKIVRTDENFWSMGDSGPCGPCTEILYDLSDDFLSDEVGDVDDGNRYLEIWNLVFMQYEQTISGERLDLAKKCIDTGMGLERICSVMQGVTNNFDTDLFVPIINKIKDVSGNVEDKTAHRVIADHLRSTSLLISDGIMPSNEKRGYVLRKIIRRAVRYSYRMGYTKPILGSVFDVFEDMMKDIFPQLSRAKSTILDILENEEKNFMVTIQRGMDILEDFLSKSDSVNNKMLRGDIAFTLYDTYGMPVDIIADILRERDLSVDFEGFDDSMDVQKERAKASWVGSGEEKAAEDIWFDLKNKNGPIDFRGYKYNSVEDCKVIAIVKDGREVSSVAGGENAQLVLDKTPFYAESGGQLGDRGVLYNDDCNLEVSSVSKALGCMHIHKCSVLGGDLRIGDTVHASIDVERRNALRRSHSATHILHMALRKILGSHVCQKGSLVDCDRLRFDFSHSKPISTDDIVKIEKIVNTALMNNFMVDTKVSSKDEALESGAMALFGEKYDDNVRVVTIGNSVELCGGTHVERSGDIGNFVIVSEGSVASGVRRIEALTGMSAYQRFNDWRLSNADLCSLLKCQDNDVLYRVKMLIDNNKNLEKGLTLVKKQSIVSNNYEIKNFGDLNILAEIISGIKGNDLRDVASTLCDKYKCNLVFIISVLDDGKAALCAYVSSESVSKVNIVDIVNAGAVKLGGSCKGGRDNFAQSGGPEGKNSKSALDAMIAEIK